MPRKRRTKLEQQNCEFRALICRANLQKDQFALICGVKERTVTSKLREPGTLTLAELRVLLETCEATDREACAILGVPYTGIEPDAVTAAAMSPALKAYIDHQLQAALLTAGMREE